jgi:hypothetical protein
MTTRQKMSGEEYLERIKALGYDTPTDFARQLGATPRAGQLWAIEGPSRSAEIILRAMGEGPAACRAVKKAIALSGIAP